MASDVARYNSVAISLHWLIAILLTGMLVTGKYMTSLDEADHLRYSLTQWHKSFGITILFLALLRVLWRVTHKPPVLPSSVTVFEKLGSHAAHLLMYTLMVVLPLSGWVMVSVSPLNLATVLFGTIPWPHIPFAEKSLLAEPSIMVHIWLANTLLFLILMHICAAFFHQLVRKDHLLSRMIISSSHRNTNDLNHGLVFGVCLGLAGLVFLANRLAPLSDDAFVETVKQVDSGADSQVDSQVSLEAGTQADTQADTQTGTAVSTVGFQVLQNGSPLDGQFSSSDITLSVDVDNPAEASLIAIVLTASVSTGDSQIDATVVTSNWFASDEYPEATFTSGSFEPAGEKVFVVRGVLTIRDTSNEIEFELILDDGVGKGQFVINRSDFGVGDGGQDEFVDNEVTIRFEASNAEHES